MQYKNLGPRASLESIETVGQCAIAIAPDEHSMSGWHSTYVAGHSNRVALDLDLVCEHAEKGSSVLEIGAIPLLLTSALVETGYKTIGVDIAPERYADALCKADLNVIKCDIEKEKLPLDSNLFDIVLFNEVFEHLRINPIFTLSEAFRVIKPGGMLMLSTPNLKSINGLYNFLWLNRSQSCATNLFKEYSKLEALGHMGHVREYTTREVTEFLQAIGFEVTTVIFRGHYSHGLRKLATKLVPRLKPFVTYLATKRDRG